MPKERQSPQENAIAIPMPEIMRDYMQGTGLRDTTALLGDGSMAVGVGMLFTPAAPVGAGFILGGAAVRLGVYMMDRTGASSGRDRQG